MKNDENLWVHKTSHCPRLYTPTLFRLSGLLLRRQVLLSTAANVRDVVEAEP